MTEESKDKKPEFKVAGDADKPQLLSPSKWGKKLGLWAPKVAGICDYAGWNEESKISEADFKKAAAVWLNFVPGSGQRLEVRK